jgi:UDP-glucose 4-epimerase
VDESHRLAPLTFYGLTKKHGEEYIRHACSEKGLATCMFRFPSFFGPQINAGAVRSFCAKVAAGEDIVINPKTAASWDLLHIRDAVDVIVRCAERMQKGELGSAGVKVFNVDYGVPVSLPVVAEKIVKLAGSRSRIKIADKSKIVDFYFDIDRARKELGWNPPSLEARLKGYMAEIREGTA